MSLVHCAAGKRSSYLQHIGTPVPSERAQPWSRCSTAAVSSPPQWREWKLMQVGAQGKPPPLQAGDSWQLLQPAREWGECAGASGGEPGRILDSGLEWGKQLGTGKPGPEFGCVHLLHRVSEVQKTQDDLEPIKLDRWQRVLSTLTDFSGQLTQKSVKPGKVWTSGSLYIVCMDSCIFSL